MRSQPGDERTIQCDATGGQRAAASSHGNCSEDIGEAFQPWSSHRTGTAQLWQLRRQACYRWAAIHCLGCARQGTSDHDLQRTSEPHAGHGCLRLPRTNAEPARWRHVHRFRAPRFAMADRWLQCSPAVSYEGELGDRRNVRLTPSGTRRVSSRPRGWPRHGFEKRSGAIFFGFIAVLAAWLIVVRYRWDAMQRYYRRIAISQARCRRFCSCHCPLSSTELNEPQLPAPSA